MTINLDAFPYYDDYDAKKGYHKVLFVPGRPLQARELTQIQSILQEQIKNNADFMFKNGSVVLPGNIYYRDNAFYVKLETSENSVLADSVITAMVGKTVFCKNADGTAIVKAQVLAYTQSEANDPPTIYIQYTSSGDDKDVSGNVLSNRATFNQNEVLYVDGDEGTVLRIQNSNTASGPAATCSISEGVYYVNGYYVQVLDQTVVVDKYTNTPTRKIGLVVEENIITEAEDKSLTDNAFGFNNYSAPGAHRLQIKLTLDSLPVAESDINFTADESAKDIKFITLLIIDSGSIVYRNDFTKLNEMEKVLADRTYDESGDYIVNDFQYKAIEYRSNNRGLWAAHTPYVEGDIVYKKQGNKTVYYVATSSSVSGTIQPSVSAGYSYDGSMNWATTTTPSFNNGLYSTAGVSLDDEINFSNQYLLQINNGRAYIKGYQVNIPGKTFLTVRKARDFERVSNAIVPSLQGSYFKITSVVGLPDINQLTPIYLYDAAASPSQVGTCRVRSIDLDSGIAGDSTAVYKLFVFDIAMNAGKSFADDVASVTDNDATYKFSANIVQEDEYLTGTISATGTTTVTGLNTLFSKELKVGQKIRVAGNTYPVVTIVNDISLTIGTALTFSNIFLAKAVTKSYGRNNLLVQMPHIFTRSLRDTDDSTVNNTYAVRRRFASAANNPTTGIVRITLANSNESFTPDTTTYVVSKLVAAGACVILKPSSVVRVDALNVDLYFTGANGSTNLFGVTTNVEVIATVYKHGIATKERKKIPKVGTVDITNWGVLKQAKYSLGEADAYRIVSVTMSGGTTTFATTDANTTTIAYQSTSESDITNRFTLDNGQTTTHYGISSAILNSAVPTKPIRIVFEYFDHTPGDYFCVNSYPTAYKDIPVLELENGVETSLRDVLDFRARISDSGADYTSTGAQVPEPLAYNVDMVANYSYYTQRCDLISVDKNKKFYVDEGHPSAGIPVPPGNRTDTLDLFTVSMWPYTVNVDSMNVTVSPRAHKRYTMNAIGSLDKRITNLEYYASLTLLEKQTKDLQILDQWGLSRFKNGFIVDEFKDHGIGDDTSMDYMCAIDAQAKELRPSFYVSEVKLLEKSSGLRASYHYNVKGGLVTLPYTEVASIIQNKASIQTKVNPWSDFDFNGTLTLYPDNDSWVNNSKSPKLAAITIDGSSSLLQNLAARTGITGTVYGDWHEIGRAATSSSLSTTQSAAVSYSSATSSSTNYYYYYYYYDYGYGGQSTTTTTTNTTTTALTTNVYKTTNYDVTSNRSALTTTADVTLVNDGSVTAVSSLDSEPYMRMRHVVMIVRGMKPNSDINVTVNGKNANQYVQLPTKLKVVSSSGTFVTYKDDMLSHADIPDRAWKGIELPDGTFMNPQLIINPMGNEYTSNTGNQLNAGNSYDLFEHGDIIKRADGRSAILLAKETEFNDGSSGTVMYITNEMGWHDSIGSSFSITGRTNGATATVTNMLQAPAKTNSAGTFVATLMIPPDVECGAATIRVSCVLDINSGAVAVYRGQGIKTNTTSTSFLEKDVTLNQNSWTDSHVTQAAVTTLQSSSTKVSSTSTSSSTTTTTCGWNYYSYYYGYYGYYYDYGYGCYYNWNYYYYYGGHGGGNHGGGEG